MPPEFNTLEEARAEIVRLNGEVSRLETEAQNYSTRINELTEENRTVRDINQQYFLQLTADKAKEDEDEDKKDEDETSLEDFAATLTI